MTISQFPWKCSYGAIILVQKLVKIKLSSYVACFLHFFWVKYFLMWQIKGFPIRGFILIYKKNPRFLWKIIWFLFRLIAEGLPLIMKNNIIYMTSTATFAGLCSFDEIFYYIFAHLGLYFVDNVTNILFEFLNWLRGISINLIFYVTPKKKV